MRIVHKNDATRVGNIDTLSMRKAPTKLVDDNGANFKIKIRRK